MVPVVDYRIITYLLSNDQHTAGLLGMPVRTLQRRLQQNGVSYSQLVEKTRFEMACRLLIAHNARVSSVAKTLGYNDHGSFSRAFQRWAGMSPREYRRQSRSRKGQKVD